MVVTSDGQNMTFTYTVSYDNPNTSTVEKAPTAMSNSYSIKNTTTSTSPMFTLGDGYGTPTTSYNYVVNKYDGSEVTKSSIR